MYKKRSSFVNKSRPLYGWSTASSSKPNSVDTDIFLGLKVKEKIKVSKEKGLYHLTDEERQKLIDEYLEKK